MKNRSIQGLRGLFAIGVLLSHCFFLQNYEQSQTLFLLVFKKTANVGFFFVIAGYFLARSSSTNATLWNFMKKKMARIYPLHLCIVVVLIGLAFITNTFSFNVAIPLTALLMQTWFLNLEIATSFNTVSWFLSSLMFCYIIGYFIIVFSRKVSSKKGNACIYLLTMLLLLYKVVVAIIYPTNDTGYYWCYFSPIAGCADFMVGISLAMFFKNRKLPTGIWLQITSLALLVVCFAMKQTIPVNFSRAIIMLPANIMITASFLTETKFSRALLGNRVLHFLGDISFEIYLLHTLIINILGSRSFMIKIAKEISPFLVLIIMISCTIVCAVIYKNIFNYLTKTIQNKRRIKNEQEN